MAPLVDGVAHGFAVDGQAFVLLAVSRVPPLQSQVELGRIDPGEKIADGELTGHQVLAAGAAAAEALTRLGGEVVGPFGDRLVPAHAAQEGPRQRMAPALAAA